MRDEFCLDMPDALSPHRFLLDSGDFPLPQHLTVGHLLRQLQHLDPDLPIRLAVNPDWPFAHYLGTDVVVGDGMAFIAEDGQEGYLPTSVRNALAWS
ncbi:MULTISPECIES: hypothetical protein [unclassified Streptomyces]|uniref:hypothetical protein n=1 Tax=unclassified Streptomyces TaxID=2593676 RepID=UPI0035A8A639